MFYVGALQAVNPEAKGFVWDFTWEIIGALVSAILEVEAAGRRERVAPGDAAAAERFQAVHSAYEVLYDESSRRAYDAASGFDQD